MSFTVPCSECGVYKPLHLFDNLTELICADCGREIREDHVAGDEPEARLPEYELDDAGGVYHVR